MADARASQLRLSQSGVHVPSAYPALLACLAVAVYALWLALVLVPTNVDVSWLIVASARLLDGERLTIDLMEVNPPFSIWMYMPFVVLERLAGGRAELWMAAAVVTTGLASVAISSRMLASQDPAYLRPRATIALPVVTFLVLCLFPGEFGQREQLAAIAVLPWVALQCARQRHPDFAAPSRWEPVLAGICATVVVMIKPPHFALALMLPSAWLAVHRRSWKPLFVFENLLGSAIVVVYVAWLLIFQRSFLSEVLPFAGAVYLPFREPFLDLVTDWPQTVLLLALMTAILAGGLRRLHSDVGIPLLSAFGFLVVFVIMGKGWPNHAWPMLMLSMMAFIIQLVRTESFWALKPVGKAAAVAGCFLVLKAAFLIQTAALLEDRTTLERTVAAVGGAAERPTIVSLAAQIQVAHPLSRLVGGDFVSRYPSAWAVYNADLLARSAADPEKRQRLEAIRDGLIAEFAEEIGAKQPDIVLYGAEAGRRSAELMLRNEKIAAALKDYEVLLQEGDVTVYRRAGAALKTPAEEPR
jgi:hypothetical protein